MRRRLLSKIAGMCQSVGHTQHARRYTYLIVYTSWGEGGGGGIGGGGREYAHELSPDPHLLRFL